MECIIAVIIGFVADMFLGDPDSAYHPIRMIGKLTENGEKVIRKVMPKDKDGEIIGGALLWLFVCGVSSIVSVIIIKISYFASPYLGIAAESVICYFMIAASGLKKESMKVYEKTKINDIDGARKAVSRIVGRDTEKLDKEGIIKAAVETVAENLSDGVIAPIFYIVIFGSVGGVFYKAVNTLDSMVGYKNEKYLYFGRFSARADDVFNFLPSRISAFFMILAAFITGEDGNNAIRIFKRDRYNHASPNSAQTEAVCAGALRIRLAGNAYYFGKLYEKPYIGDGLEKIDDEAIVRANKLMYVASVMALLVMSAVRAVFTWIL
ncbi:MAG: cobalamin biosynthesis protein CobD [Firmicutes bacterium]|nr:cobalamin biosynthesis protein CobD [Bacillota bacterium]